MRIISQGACPKCPSSDAYTEYDDGHCWCFSCKYLKPAKVTSIEQVSSILLGKSQANYLDFPDDFSHLIAKEPLTWLKKYGLTQAEIEKFEYGWSEKEQLLIAPFFNSEGNLFFWNGRYFPARNPKAKNNGDIKNTPTFIQQLDKPTDGCVVVEDMVSAIKVSRHMDACPLFGAHLSLFKAIEISKQYKTLFIWLDEDKAKDASTLRERYNSLFTNIFVIVTKLDPKELSDLQIKENLV